MSGQQMTSSKYSSHTCPLCETADTVKGDKVCDKHGRWWSYCFGDHTEFQHLLAERVPDDRMYFSWVSADHALLESVENHVVHVVWE